jgi:hypothetical protein
MGFDESRRPQLRQLSRESKITMLKQHHAKENGNGGGAGNAGSGLLGTTTGLVASALTGVGTTRLAQIDRSSPECCARQLMEHLQRLKSSSGFSSTALCKLLTSLRINITSQPIGWIQEFIEDRGMAVYLRLFESYLQRQRRYFIQF